MDARHEVCRMARNAASVVAVPWEELPDGAARGLLLEMAYAGLDVAARQSDEGCWRVRIGREEMSCAAWRAKFAV